MLLLLISFTAGVLTVLAPCILPLLPVIVGGSLAGGGVDKKRAFTIIISLGLSVIAFTFLLKASTLLIDIPPDFWKWFSGGIIALIGITFIFPRLYEGGLLTKLSAKSNQALGEGNQKKNFWGNVIIGVALGPVFSTCSPTYFVVLATVLPVSLALGVVYIFAYVIGLSLALLLISLAGQKLMHKMGLAADPKGWVKRIFGIIFLIVGIAIISGLDKKLEIAVLDGGLFDITKVEQRLLELTEQENMREEIMPTGETKEESQKEPSVDEGSQSATTPPKNKAELYPKYIDISTPDAFINTDPITIESLIGKKVILVDFWTYSCINCQRTLPYLNAWYEKYENKGLEIIGIHTPEFAFEKLKKNVADAVERFGVKHPVVLDNDFSTWNAYGNRYWPRKYLIDIDGYIVYDHIGEGAYEETERQIMKALEERAERLAQEIDLEAGLAEVTGKTSQAGSPEVYFGSWRNDLLANGEIRKLGEQNFVLSEQIEKNKLYLGGSWDITKEYAENKNEAKIVFRFEAKEVYMVASAPTAVEVEIYQDEKFVKNLTIGADQLYILIENEKAGEHILEIRIPEAGLQAFTFTFG